MSRQSFTIGKYIIQLEKRYKYADLTAYETLPNNQHDLVAQQQYIPLNALNQATLDTFLAQVDPLLTLITPRPQLDAYTVDEADC